MLVWHATLCRFQVSGTFPPCHHSNHFIYLDGRWSHCPTVWLYSMLQLLNLSHFFSIGIVNSPSSLSHLLCKSWYWLTITVGLMVSISFIFLCILCSSANSLKISQKFEWILVILHWSCQEFRVATKGIPHQKARQPRVPVQWLRGLQCWYYMTLHWINTELPNIFIIGPVPWMCDFSTLAPIADSKKHSMQRWSALSSRANGPSYRFG